MIRKFEKLIQCKIFHIQFNYVSGSFQICKEAMHIDSLRVNGMSVKMFISVRSYFHHRVIYRPHITIPILYSFDMKVFSDSLNLYMFFSRSCRQPRFSNQNCTSLDIVSNGINEKI